MFKTAIILLSFCLSVGSYAASVNLNSGASYVAENGDKVTCTNAQPRCLCLVAMNNGSDVLLVQNQYRGTIIRRWAISSLRENSAQEFEEAGKKCAAELAAQSVCQ